MNLLEEYKNMSSKDKKEFIRLVKYDLEHLENNQITYNDFINILKEKNVDVKLFFTLLDKSDEIIKLADTIKEINGGR